MAIYHLHTNCISRAQGQSAVAAAAYRAGVCLQDERIDKTFDYTRKGGVLSSEIVAPAGIHVPDRQALWNAAEAAERRVDSRTAREWRAALPAELSPAGRETLARRFAQSLANRYGVAVDVSLHAPDRDGDERNFHVHMLATTRKIDRFGNLGEKAEIELGNKDRRKAGIPGTTQDEIKAFREHWAEITNEALERSGSAERVDHRSFAAIGLDLTPTTHIGVHAVNMTRRGLDADRAADHAAIREKNAQAIERDPVILLDKISRMKAVFTERDIAKELHRYIDEPTRFQNLMARVSASPELVALSNGNEVQKSGVAVFSTREMIASEQMMLDSARDLDASRTTRIDPKHIAAAFDKRPALSEQQKRAVEHATSAQRLSIVIGDAGTGKSYAMDAAREAWEAQGLRVLGGALSGKAAEGLQAGSGIQSTTLHSLEARLRDGKETLGVNDVLVIDEAGMVSSRQLGRVLHAAEVSGAKVVMLGDNKQIAAVEAGAGFRAITDRLDVVEITEVRRQREEWQRSASNLLARQGVQDGLQAYRDHDAVRLKETREDAKAALVVHWLQDREKGGSSVILAHQNAEVTSFNETVREALADNGTLGPSTTFQTEKGKREFADGDRLVFLKNNADLKVKNGTLGTVSGIDGQYLSVTLDDGQNRLIDTQEYGHFDHGYAVTIHKSQGMTVDRSYVLATPTMDRNLTYVAMTRHRDAARMYGAEKDFKDYTGLAEQLARERPKESTLDYGEDKGYEPRERSAALDGEDVVIAVESAGVVERQDRYEVPPQAPQQIDLSVLYEPEQEKAEFTELQKHDDADLRMAAGKTASPTLRAVASETQGQDWFATRVVQQRAAPVPSDAKAQPNQHKTERKQEPIAPKRAVLDFSALEPPEASLSEYLAAASNGYQNAPEGGTADGNAWFEQKAGLSRESTPLDEEKRRRDALAVILAEVQEQAMRSGKKLDEAAREKIEQSAIKRFDENPELIEKVLAQRESQLAIEKGAAKEFEQGATVQSVDVSIEQKPYQSNDWFQQKLNEHQQVQESQSKERRLER